MKRLSDLEYLKLNKWQAFWYNVGLFFCAIPLLFKKLGLSILKFFKDCGIAVKDEFVDIGSTFKRGNWAVRLSFLIFGFGNFYYGQILRGILFLLFEVVFIGYMLVPSGGIYWLAKGNWFKVGATIGTVEPQKNVYDPVMDQYITIWGDDSVKVLLYGLLTIIFIIAFIYTWRLQVKQCRICLDITAKGKKVRSGKDDVKSLLDDQFHKTLLALPLMGILAFTVLPIIYMVLIAFTSYDAAHDG